MLCIGSSPVIGTGGFVAARAVNCLVTGCAERHASVGLGSTPIVRVVVLGGSGNFGARICRALHIDPAIDVVCASRTARDRFSASDIRSVPLDARATNFEPGLRALAPDLVIHCVGPFQGQDYRVAHAALGAGAHYLDLADGRAFVAGFAAANDAAARANNRLAISGASTLPALSSAVLDEVVKRLPILEAVEIIIAPGQRAPRGTATLQSVFGYLGKPFLWLRDGRWVQVYGWQDLKRIHLEFGLRWSAACDVPDLELLPQRYPSVRTVEFRAALEFGVQHLTLWLLAALRRRGMLVSIERWALSLDRTASAFDPLGGAFGGMQVSVIGTAPGGARRRITWHLTAPATDGPEIPCMPAILLTQRFQRGELTQRGAYPCMGFLSLADFAPEFARWGIRSRMEETDA
jgi:Saccharopine dehydrogenase NADP binding domain